MAEVPAGRARAARADTDTITLATPPARRGGAGQLRLGLRWAMLVAMLPVLLLPLAGMLFLSDMATMTRDERREQLAATARGLAAALHERDDLFGADARSPLPGGAEPMPVATLPAVRVDGVADEWAGIVMTPLPTATLGDAPSQTLDVDIAVARVPAGGGRLIMIVRVLDERYLEPEPRLVMGEDIAAAFSRAEPALGERDGDLLLVRAGSAHDDLQPLDASVTPSADGWLSEVLLPADTRFVRVRVRDVDYQASRRLEATADSGLLALGMLADGTDAGEAMRADTREAALIGAMRGFGRAGGRVTVFDGDRGVLARLGEVDVGNDGDAGERRRGVGRTLVSWAVGLGRWSDTGGGDVDPLARALRGFGATRSVRLEDGQGDPYWLTTSVQPVWLNDRVAGALMLEQADESDLARAQSAFEWLAMFTALAVLAAVLSLLGFATLTVARIRHLKHAAEQAIDLRGRVTGEMPRFRLRDEIASLSDGYARVLGRLREHQQYLANLRGRLVHELRTPIMVVRSSLDNLADVGPDDPARDDYLQRAQGGTLRLERIVASMSEAANLESMLGDSALERVDLVALLRELVAAYNQAWSSRGGLPPASADPGVSGSAAATRFVLESGLAQAPAAVVPEAIAQAVDKLASNARDFATPGSEVRLRLSVAADAGAGLRYRIAMINQGPPLPALMADSLFDSMVSVRGGSRQGESHLGLGLYLVRLIAEFHGGEPFANDEQGGVVVGFTIGTGLDSAAPENGSRPGT